MKKQLQKFKKNKKGFTLVELIIVIAIIVILAAVLAPQYIRYVEKSRVATDKNAMDEIKHNVEIALGDPEIYAKAADAASSGELTETFVDNTAPTGGSADLEAEVGKTLGNSGAVDFKSKTYDGSTYTVKIKFDTTNQTVEVTGTNSADKKTTT